MPGALLQPSASQRRGRHLRTPRTLGRPGGTRLGLSAWRPGRIGHPAYQHRAHRLTRSLGLGTVQAIGLNRRHARRSTILSRSTPPSGREHSRPDQQRATCPVYHPLLSDEQDLSSRLLHSAPLAAKISFALADVKRPIRNQGRDDRRTGLVRRQLLATIVGFVGANECDNHRCHHGARLGRVLDRFSLRRNIPG